MSSAGIEQTVHFYDNRELSVSPQDRDGAVDLMRRMRAMGRGCCPVYEIGEEGAEGGGGGAGKCRGRKGVGVERVESGCGGRMRGRGGETEEVGVVREEGEEGEGKRV